MKAIAQSSGQLSIMSLMGPIENRRQHTIAISKLAYKMLAMLHFLQSQIWLTGINRLKNPVQIRDCNVIIFYRYIRFNF